MPILLKTTKFYYRVGNSQPYWSPFWTRLMQSTACSFRIHFNIILKSMPACHKCCLPLHLFRTKLCMKFSSNHACYMSHPASLYLYISKLLFHWSWELCQRSLSHWQSLPSRSGLSRGAKQSVSHKEGAGRAPSVFANFPRKAHPKIKACSSRLGVGHEGWQPHPGKW
jgi:hypothetical protein